MKAQQSRILVVDDDASHVECVRVALEAQGHQVQVARDGSEALARLETETLDIVILDVIMPRRTGFAVLGRIRRRPDGSPRVLIASGNDAPRYREYATSQGADAFLAKPFELSELIATIDGWLSPQAHRE